MQQPLRWSLLAGAVSFLILALATSGRAQSFLLIYFPMLPLMLAGFAFGPKAGMHSLGIVTGLAFVTLGAGATLFFLGVLGLPAAYIIWRYLERVPTNHGVHWFSPSRMLVSLIGYACLGLAATAMYFSADEGGLQGFIGGEYRKVVDLAPPDARVELSAMEEQMTFFLPGLIVTIWAVMTMFIAWLAHFTLESYGRTLRPTFRPGRDVMFPHWLLMALVGATLMIVTGEGHVQFAAKICLIILLLPYALLGLITLHHVSRAWPARWVLLSLVYMLCMRGWPLVALAIAGVFLHLRELAKQYASPGNTHRENDRD